MNKISASLRIEYFDAIKNNTKKFEGRLKRDKWAIVSTGYTIVFTSGDNTIEKTVGAIYHYKSFTDAVQIHGDELIPKHLLQNGQSAESVYTDIYTVHDIDQYGVVIFKLI